MKNKRIVLYEQPGVEVIDVEVEMGFALTDGGTNDEQGWGSLQ